MQFQTKLRCFGAILILYLSVGDIKSIQAQPRTIIKANVLSPIFNSIALSGEYQFQWGKSIALSGYYTRFSSNSVDFQGFGLTPEWRFYLDTFEAPAGFFVNTFVRYQDLNLKQTAQNQEALLHTYGLGAGLGGQWVFDIRPTITLEVFGGAVYDFYDLKLLENAIASDFDIGAFTKLNPRFGLTVGLGF